jgi:hypothetical protein
MKNQAFLDMKIIVYVLIATLFFGSCSIFKGHCRNVSFIYGKKDNIIGPVVFQNNTDSCSNILLKDGDTISAIVLEVSSTQIKYKKCDRAYSPIYIIESSKVEKIIYPDGAEDIIISENDQPKAPNPDQAFKKAVHVYLHESQEVTYDTLVSVFFKNGKSIDGYLVRRKPDKYIQVKGASGQINTYSFSDIEHVDYKTEK